MVKSLVVKSLVAKSLVAIRSILAGIGRAFRSAWADVVRAAVRLVLPLVPLVEPVARHIVWRARILRRIGASLVCLVVGHRWHVIARQGSRIQGFRHRLVVEVAVCERCSTTAQRTVRE